MYIRIKLYIFPQPLLLRRINPAKTQPFSTATLLMNFFQLVLILFLFTRILPLVLYFFWLTVQQVFEGNCLLELKCFMLQEKYQCSSFMLLSFLINLVIFLLLYIFTHFLKGMGWVPSTEFQLWNSITGKVLNQ